MVNVNKYPTNVVCKSNLKDDLNHTSVNKRYFYPYL